MNKFNEWHAKNKRSIRSLDELVCDYRNDIGNSKDGHAGEANTLEAIIVLASKRFCKIMNDMGNDNEQENKGQLCDAIQDPAKWETRQLL